MEIRVTPLKSTDNIRYVSKLIRNCVKDGLSGVSICRIHSLNAETVYNVLDDMLNVYKEITPSQFLNLSQPLRRRI